MHSNAALAADGGHDPAHAVLAIIVTSYLMLVIDISIVLTGLPKIQAELGFSHAQLSWVQNAYTLAFGGLLLLGARAGDILGRRRMFVTGLAVFTLASLAIGVSPSAAWMLAWRAVQGMGAAVLAPSTLALLSAYFPEGPQRTRALSLYAAAAGVGATAGLFLGGLFADLVSWRAGFFINLPIGVALMVAARRFIAETPRLPGQFDVAGAVSSTLGMGALVYAIVRSAESSWSDPAAYGSLAAAVVLLWYFIAHEARAAQPILPLKLFASRQRSGAYAARMLFLGGMVGFWFFGTQYLQGVLHFGPLAAGLAFLPTTLPNFLSAMLVPRFTRRWGNTGLLNGGLVLGAIGLAWLGQATAQSSYVTAVALPMVLIGLAQGAVLAPLTMAAVAGVEPENAGAASGLVNVAHQLGGSLGLGALVAVFAASTPAALPEAERLAHGIGQAMLGSAVLLGAAFFVVLVTNRPVRVTQGTSAAGAT